MKKNLLVVFVVILSLSLGMVSCSKEADNLNVPTTKEQVRIFVSSSSPQSGLKSASTTSDSIGIANGDTTKAVRDVPTLMYAIDENGKPVKGRWEIYFEKNDYLNSELMSVNNYFGHEGDQITHGFPECGVYKVVFKRFTSNDEVMHFFVFIGGIPGKAGDEYGNGYIFRMEIKSVVERNSNKTKNLVFVFFRYAERPRVEEAYCLIHFFNQQNVFLSFKEIKLNVWAFNRDYFYFIIDPMDTPRGYLVAEFVTNSGQAINMIDQHNYFSSLSVGWDGIRFAIQ